MNGTVVVRPAVFEDALDMARIHVHAWRRAYRGILPDAYLDELDVGRSCERWSTTLSDIDEAGRPPGHASYYVAVIGDEVAGMCGVGAGRDAGYDHFEELRMINVSPDRWNRGVGSALLSAHHRRLTMSGTPSYLWVAEKNLRARRFYERSGWECSDEVKDDIRFTPALREVKYYLRLSDGRIS